MYAGIKVNAFKQPETPLKLMLYIVVFHANLVQTRVINNLTLNVG